MLVRCTCRFSSRLASSLPCRPVYEHATRWRQAYSSASHAARAQLDRAIRQPLLERMPSSGSIATAINQPLVGAVRVQWPDGAASSFDYMWLRDHCQSSESMHHVTRQRLLDTASLSRDLAPRAIDASSEGLKITWNDMDAHTSFYPWQWLRRRSYSPSLHCSPTFDKHLWAANEMQQSPPIVDYASVMSGDEGLLDWLDKIHIYGFAFVQGVPVSPEATEQLIRRIAFIRETHYGGFWDFTADLAHGDTAYTNLALGAHTDTTYFTDPCGLQMFHLLSSRDTHEGGHSLLVDGFACAARLRADSPQLYKLLSELPIPSHASGDANALLRPLRPRPALEHDDEGQLISVRWNNDDRAPIGQGKSWQGLWTLDDGRRVSRVVAFYHAVQAWERIVRSKQAEYWTPLEPGKALIFDNLRVLHGRSSFTGQRRLCGAYVNGDDYRSKRFLLRRRLGKQIEDDAVF
ncbi:uncharacterized protein L969DRAFT_88126 [Mixia osmundae IAM 14324]|uniref:trimethyllysine dioxygenase n=1 Tax=Mixia osmundae (strain CBS 9802 / IAM 14324 / JCM 22182 / KY 12970) TaxID=764103 RepID=G7E152_MIXOS|nr:uncharacterized protein L969DRAFT_88126 [Mixia osmundae IAM 14324]KEI38799.1 hypothetical protein L969DRAFT_88126 [Mixia osmundae IAM 14324]GAA96562.1 hypothetical protein E5Q_03231 [Mixia osmundae IAM 14324]